MSLDCILIGFNDEKMETAIKRIEPYKSQGAAYQHMLTRSAIVDGKRMKYSELIRESISSSLGMESDLSIYRMPNMAVHYLKQYLNKRDISVEIINNYNFGKKRLQHLLKTREPLLVGVSSTCIVESASLREMVDFIRANNPDVTVVIGGPFINSINYEYHDQQQKYLLQRMGADIFVHERQGENTLFRICLELKKENPDMGSIPNILYRDGKEFKRTIKVPEDISLDADPIKAFTFYENHIRPPVYVRTSISCALNCAFCRYPILGGELMYMELESIEMNLDYIYSLRVKYLVFVDDSLNIPIERFKSLLKLMIRKKYNFKWCSFFRISHSDEETYKLMEESGCLGVILGIESGNNTILKNMDKKVTREKHLFGMEQLRKHNIISYASCIIGFPGETLETARETLQFIEEAKPVFYDLQTWFYEGAVPIAKEKEYYHLTGYGYDWSHKDMNSATAAKIVGEGIKTIKNSTFMPSLSFNLWSFAYYISQGAKLDEFLSFSNIFKKVIDYEKDEVDDRYKENIKKLMMVFKDNQDLYDNLKIRKG